VKTASELEQGTKPAPSDSDNEGKAGNSLSSESVGAELLAKKGKQN
jgi:hypothetical protein